MGGSPEGFLSALTSRSSPHEERYSLSPTTQPVLWLKLHPFETGQATEASSLSGSILAGRHPTEVSYFCIGQLAHPSATSSAFRLVLSLRLRPARLLANTWSVLCITRSLNMLTYQGSSSSRPAALKARAGRQRPAGTKNRSVFPHF